VAFVVALRLAPEGTAIAVAVKLSVSAVLAPARSMAESSLIDTLPALVNVSVPKLVVSAALSPSTMDVPLYAALLVTERLVPRAAGMPAGGGRGRLPAAVVPGTPRAGASRIETAPGGVELSTPQVLGGAPPPAGGDGGGAEGGVVGTRRVGARRVRERRRRRKSERVRRADAGQLRRRAFRDRHGARGVELQAAEVVGRAAAERDGRAA